MLCFGHRNVPRLALLVVRPRIVAAGMQDISSPLYLNFVCTGPHHCVQTGFAASSE
jgi:hypothetical protein